MLHEFLTANHAELIERCRLKVAQRRAPRPTEAELEHGIPHFLDQLIKTLRVEQTDSPMRSREVSGESGGGDRCRPRSAPRQRSTGESCCSAASP